MKPKNSAPSCRARALLLPPLLVLAAAAAGSPAAWAGPRIVPFTASVTTLEAVAPDQTACPDSPPYLKGETTGRGTASQIGPIEFTATDCISPGTLTYSFGKGSLTIKAVNGGDTLTATYSGTLVPLPNPLQFQLFTAIGHFTVTGGTGRFHGASGSGYLQGIENIQTTPGELSPGRFNLVGVLSY